MEAASLVLISSLYWPLETFTEKWSLGYIQELASYTQNKLSMIILKCFNLFFIKYTRVHKRRAHRNYNHFFLCFKLKLFSQWEKETKGQQQHEAAGKIEIGKKGATASDRKRWPCPECGNTPINLARHLSTVHKDLGWTNKKADRYFIRKFY